MPRGVSRGNRRKNQARNARDRRRPRRLSPYSDGPGSRGSESRQRRPLDAIGELMLRFTPLLVLALIVSPLASAAEFVPATRVKKLISYGSDWPNTVYVRQHVREMEKQPFDGIVIG